MYPFYHTTHRSFKNTFLQNVIIAIRYSPVEEETLRSEYNDRISAYFDAMFHIVPNDDFWTKGISVSKEDNSIDLFFSNGVLACRVGAKDYRSFMDSVFPQVLKQKIFLERVLNINTINSVIIRKINNWRFRDDAKLKLDDVKAFIFSKDLISSLSNVNLTADEKKCTWFDNLSFSNSYT